MTPEIRRHEELPQNEIKQALQGYLNSDEFSQRVKTKNSRLAYTWDINQFGEYCRESEVKSLRSLDSDHINRWFEMMRANGLSPSTIARRKSSLVGFLDWAGERELLNKELFELSIPKWNEGATRRSRKGLNQEQQDLLLDAAKRKENLRDAVFIMITLQTGASLEQIINLDRQDILIQENEQMGIRLKNRNNEGFDIKQVDEEAKEVIIQYLDIVYVDPNKPLFPGSRNNERITHQGLWYILREYRLLSGVPNLTPSMLRNTYFENLARQKKENPNQN